MHSLRHLLLTSLLGFSILVLLTACQSRTPGQRMTLSYEHLPTHPLYALSVADACIVVLDADKQTVVGTIRSPQLNASTDIVLNTRHELVTTKDADADHDYREVLFIDPEQGEQLKSVTVSWAPVQLAISANDKLLVGHTLEKSSNGRFDLSILDAQKQQLAKEIETDGYVADVAFAGNLAYLAVVAVHPDKQPGILVYDLQHLTPQAFYPIPQPHNAPPLLPQSLALAGEGSATLYINLFQFDENSPCQQKGHLAQMDVRTGAVKLMQDLEDVGPMVITESGDLLVGESCGGREGRVLLIDARNGDVKRQQVLGAGISAMRALGQGRYAISVFEESAIIFLDVDAWEGTTVSLPCVWPEHLAFAAQ